jgi:hypothetical protein
LHTLDGLFARALRKAVGRIGPDRRTTVRDARVLRRALSNRKVAGAALLIEPDAVLGAFDSLPSNSRRAMVETVTQDGRWRMAAYNLGIWHAPLARGLRRVQSKLPSGHLVGQLAELFAAALQVGPGWALHTVYRRCLALTARFARRPRIPAVLAAAGVDVRDLAVRYVRGVPQLPAYRGFWHDPTSHTTVGLLVGLDLIENSEGYWFLESNMDCGFKPERTALYEEDPFVRNLLDFTATQGYGRLIVLSGSSPVDPVMGRQFERGAAARNLAVTLLEDAFQPSFGHKDAVQVPGCDEPRTILVRNRHYRTNIDYVVQHKRASTRALRIYKQESGDSSFQLPMTSDEPCVGPTDPTDPFPNLVFKFPERDNSRGVFFLKVASASHARELVTQAVRDAPPESAARRFYNRLDDQRGLWQSYVRTPWLSGRRLYRTRAHVLLTPVGVHYLSAHRIVCGFPVPEELPPGVVRDPRPYLVNYVRGARFEVVPSEEETAVRESALGIARGLSRAISFGFETEPRADAEAERGSEIEAGERPRVRSLRSRVARLYRRHGGER